MVIELLALQLIQLTGPEDQVIDINPQSIVSLRQPRSAEHFAKGAKCLLNMGDGKIIVVMETCSEVIHIIDGAKLE